MFVNIAYDTIRCQKLDCVALHTNLLVQQIELSEATTDAKPQHTWQPRPDMLI